MPPTLVASRSIPAALRPKVTSAPPATVARDLIDIHFAILVPDQLPDSDPQKAVVVNNQDRPG